MNPKEQLRAWLAQSIGVLPDAVTDDHLAQWCALRDSVRAYKPTDQQAAGARANGRFLGVHVEPNVPAAKPEHAKWYGPRAPLAGEET